jgi:hypothetical protein
MARKLFEPPELHSSWLTLDWNGLRLLDKIQTDRPQHPPNHHEEKRVQPLKTNVSGNLQNPKNQAELVCKQSLDHRLAMLTDMTRLFDCDYWQ